MSENLFELFASRFPADSSALALETDAGLAFSYGDLERETARYAAWLTGLGVAPGERVAVQVEKSHTALFLYLACLRAGLAYLPLNSAYQQAEMRFFLEDAEPRVVVAQPNSMPWLAPIAQSLGIAHVYTLDDAGNGTLVDAARHAPERFTPVARRGDDLAAILYTSGTTGRSKGAMLTHRNLSSNALTLHRAWGFRPGDVLLHMLPIFHVHGLFVACHTALLNGSKMLFHARFDAKRALAELARATVFMGVPTFYTRLVAEPGLDRGACHAIRLFVSGSAPLLPETFATFRSLTGHTILERYGMTETGMLTSNPLDGERRAGTVGMALHGVQVRVVDDGDKGLPAGEIGAVQVKGDNVLPGYWRLPEKNKEEFTRDGFFRTGDVGRFSPDGYLSIVGRSKDLIITGGYNVYPKEIELVIDKMAGVAESAVIGLPHADFGESVTAVVVRRAGASGPMEGEIIAALKTQLANYKVPKRVFFLDDLPRNAMGKVQKNALRKRFASP
jgi:malonyl-CoA/methylmalonyl-CoA synthetase